MIRMGLVDALEEAGFRVIEAATGAAGLYALEKDEDLTALLTDIEMPGTPDGLGLAQIVHERCPEAAVIVMSGRIRPGVGMLPPNARFFDKPYLHDEVVAALQGLLEVK
ncbi:response regulator [Aurantimonas aggregata]|uniref:Response regulator n=2 Tax=Aurantimonas aggregata TaxID=2047720 RepID=A0A6L9MCS4_9HYPH|nr:response regulator [Aurantimonas aggregata]